MSDEPNHPRRRPTTTPFDEVPLVAVGSDETSLDDFSQATGTRNMGARVRFQSRFQWRLLAWLIALTAATSAIAGYVYYLTQVEFVKLAPDRAYEVGGVQVTPAPQMHSGESFGYRFERAGKSVVYTTDSEHKLENRAQTERFVRFFRDADLVVFDAMYSLADAISVKADWGHSSNIIGVELCQMARARHLVLFHHEPSYDDATIEGVLRETRRFEELTRGTRALQISAAHDGLEIDV